MLGGKRYILCTVNISMSYMNYFHHHSKFLVTCSLTSHTQLYKPAAIFCTKELRAYTSFKTISYLFSLSLGMERRKVFPAWFFLFLLLITPAFQVWNIESPCRSACKDFLNSNAFVNVHISLLTNKKLL